MLLAEGMGLHSMKKLHNKKRKTVDRRASKGRKIRYSFFLLHLSLLLAYLFFLSIASYELATWKTIQSEG
jgi:hypothetical protein